MQAIPTISLNTITGLFKDAPYPVIIVSREAKLLFQNTFFTSLDEFFSGEAKLSLNFFIQLLIDDSRGTLQVHSGNKLFSFSITGNNELFVIIGTEITAIANERNFFQEVLDSLPAEVYMISVAVTCLLTPKALKTQS
jgi:hypothetical protein